MLIQDSRAELHAIPATPALAPATRDQYDRYFVDSVRRQIRAAQTELCDIFGRWSAAKQVYLMRVPARAPRWIPHTSLARAAPVPDDSAEHAPVSGASTVCGRSHAESTAMHRL
jgi:hypothetical protein